jgi:hypothetical protein
MSLVTGLLSRDWWRRGITITARLSAFSSDIGFVAALREVNPARKEKASIIAWRGCDDVDAALGLSCSFHQGPSRSYCKKHAIEMIFALDASRSPGNVYGSAGDPLPEPAHPTGNCVSSISKIGRVLRLCGNCGPALFTFHQTRGHEKGVSK